MQVVYSGVDHPHENGEFCQRILPELYGLFFFHTPFLYEKDGKMLRGSPEELLLTKPGQPVFHGPIDADHSFVNDWMYVTKDLAPLLERYPIPCGTNIRLSNPRILRQAILKLREENIRKNTGYEEKIRCILTETVIDLYRAQLSEVRDKTTECVEAVHDRVMQALEQNWTLEAMAGDAGFSVSHFSQIWSERYGCSPKAELLQKRLELAQQLLVCSPLTVSEIAERCGFQSIYYFSKCFKKHLGLSPRKFAQMQQV